jgi:predicted RNase H-like nuclease (RuvC/YqgF family)
MEELKAKNEALQNENAALKGVIKSLNAEKQSLEINLTEAIRDKINLRSAGILLEGERNLLNNEVKGKDAKIKELEDQLAQPKEDLAA